MGPVYAGGYHGWWPDTNWVGQDPSTFADFCEWVAGFGLSITLVVFPDCGIYWHGTEAGWDWAAIDRDLKPLYDQDRVRAAVSRVQFGWEIWTYVAGMIPGYDRMRAWFPTQERCWHNGPEHASPGMGTEEERPTWQTAADHGIHRLLFQGFPLSTDPATIDRPPLDQLKYDLWDMWRRFNGTDGSPWGPTPILTERGTPLEVEYAEAAAYDITNHNAPESIGTTLADAALSVAGASRNTTDGLPSA